MKTEKWKAIKGYKGMYEVSNLGNIRSLDRTVRGRNNVRQRIKGVVLKLKPSRNTGYIQVNLYKKGKGGTKLVHRLVCEAFHGPAPRGKEYVNHLDGDKTNNRADNLQWSSCSENNKHAFSIGLNHKGSTHGRSTLTETQVLLICEMLDEGSMQHKDIALMFNTNKHVIFSIHIGRSWNWLTGRKGKIVSSNMKGENHPQSKSVVNCRGEVFKTSREACLTYGIHASLMSRVLKGKGTHAGKYPDGKRIKWRLHE